MTVVGPGPDRLERLEAGQPVVYGGDRIARVSEDLAREFAPGDRLVVVQDTGALLRIPAADHALADAAVTAAHQAFRIAAANSDDVAAAGGQGRSTTRLVLSDRMRGDMVAGLRTWRDMPSERDQLIDGVEHPGWRVERRRAPLGVIGFVFEGRPNVFADATGVLRGGNTVVFRIGRDALGTAIAIHEQALVPALADAGLPLGAAALLASPSRATGYAMFSHPRLALAVVRGSGPAVAELGAVARQAGVPVSLHGTGGAWLVAGVGADPDRFAAAGTRSLDR